MNYNLNKNKIRKLYDDTYSIDQSFLEKQKINSKLNTASWVDKKVIVEASSDWTTLTVLPNLPAIGQSNSVYFNFTSALGAMYLSRMLAKVDQTLTLPINYANYGTLGINCNVLFRGHPNAFIINTYPPYEYTLTNSGGSYIMTAPGSLGTYKRTCPSLFSYSISGTTVTYSIYLPQQANPITTVGNVTFPFPSDTTIPLYSYTYFNVEYKIVCRIFNYR